MSQSTVELHTYSWIKSGADKQVEYVASVIRITKTQYRFQNLKWEEVIERQVALGTAASLEELNKKLERRSFPRAQPQ